MAFLKYSDVPVFANFTTENNNVLWSNDSSHLFAATQASISLNPNLAANRYLGKAQARNDFSPTGPLEAKISMTFFPMIETWGQNDLNISRDNQLNFFKTTGDFSLGHSMLIGSYWIKRVYLQNYSVKINPYQPVSVTANFIAYNLESVTNVVLAGIPASVIMPIAKDGSKPYYKALHGLTTAMDGSTDNLPSTKTSIQVNVDCQRTPIYTLGNKTPSSVILTAVERTTTVEGESIGTAVSLSGANPGATNIYFQPLDNSQAPTDNSYMLKFDINGRIVSQDISVSQQGFLNGKVVIKEIIL